MMHVENNVFSKNQFAIKKYIPPLYGLNVDFSSCGHRHGEIHSRNRGSMYVAVAPSTRFLP